MRHLALFLWVACTNETVWRAVGESPPRPSTEAMAPPDRIEDVIVQMTSPQVDVLWVIDASCSMGPYQERLTAHFPSFMQFFLSRQLDYHVGVTSTDMDGVLGDGSEGRLRTLGGAPYITPDTPDPVARFAAIADLGTRGSSSERGTSATHAALVEREDTENFGFFRPTAALHTIVISDESNQIAPGEPSLDEWLEWYDQLKPSSELRTFSSITSVLGLDYERATQTIGGIHWSIDTQAWDVVLERLGFRAAGLHSEYFLSQRPLVETLEVRIELHDVPNHPDEVVTILLDPDTEFTYDASRNAIRLVNQPPEHIALVAIRYLPAAP